MSRSREVRDQEQEDTKYYSFLIRKIKTTNEKELNNFDKREYAEYYANSKVFKEMADTYEKDSPSEIRALTSPATQEEAKRFESEEIQRVNSYENLANMTPAIEYSPSKSRPVTTEQNRLKFLEKEVSQLKLLNEQEKIAKEQALKDGSLLKEELLQKQKEVDKLREEILVLKQKLELKPEFSEISIENEEVIGDQPPDEIPNELLDQFGL